jgi:hypothetical protein
MPRPARKHSTPVAHAMRSLTVPKTLVEPVLNGVVGREQEGDDILNVIAFLRQHSSYIR